MARTDITVTEIVRTGVVQTATQGIVDGHQFLNDSRTLARIENTNAAASVTVTFQTPIKIHGLDLVDLVVTIPASSVRYSAPFPRAVFNQSDGKVYVDYSAPTTTKIEIYKLPL